VPGVARSGEDGLERQIGLGVAQPREARSVRGVSSWANTG
jgi:hypothetical protein